MKNSFTPEADSIRGLKGANPFEPVIEFTEASPRDIGKIEEVLRKDEADGRVVATEIERLLSPSQRVAYAYQRLQEQKEAQKTPEFPKMSFLGDGGSIENQQVTMIEQPDEIQLSFTLSETKYAEALKKFSALGKPDAISFAVAGNPKKNFSLKKAHSLSSREGMTIQVAAEADITRQLLSKVLSDPGFGYGATHAFDRRTVIKIPKALLGDPPDFRKLAEQIDSIMSDMLGIENGLRLPEPAGELEGKKSALAEQLKKRTDEITDEEAERLERQEVFPGTFSYVEKGRSERVMHTSPYAVYHRIQLGENNKGARELIRSVLSGHGLMSTTERLERGMMVDGSSSFVDVGTGGAAYAFARMASQEGLKGKDQKLAGYYFVFDPEILDRTDWHAYFNDNFGSTDPRFYDKRPATDNFIETMRKGHKDMNEMMFRGGIPKERIRAVVCSTEEERKNLIAELKSSGLKTLNGKPLDEFVKVGNLGTMIELSTSERHRLPSKKLKKIAGQRGMNEGGFYADPATGEKLYIKFYKDPDQAKYEYLANAIYTRLGIRAPRSEIFEMDGRLALGSSLIPDVRPMKPGELRADGELRDGFVADAYLANWDVVGDNYENVCKDKAGKTWRLDAGGALRFRAMGKTKQLEPDSVPELDSMRDPKFTAGKIFDKLSEEEMAKQAQAILDKLPDELIHELIYSARLSENQEKEMHKVLIGRKKALMRRFGLTPKPRTS